MKYSGVAAAFTDQFKLYRRLSRKKIEEALLKQGSQLAWDLYRETKAVSPTKKSLFAIPAAVGWRIRRPKGWAVFDMPSPPRTRSDSKRNTRAKRRKRWDFKPGEMNRRVKGIGVTARAWIPPYWPGNPNWSVRKIKRPRGFVVMALNGDELSVTLFNRFPGMPGLDARFGVIEKALTRRVNDMRVYIDRKLTEAAQEAGMK